MVDPISNQMFSHDFEAFVLQIPKEIPKGPIGVPRAPFTLGLSRKKKDEMKKESSPWVSKKAKAAEGQSDGSAEDPEEPLG